ncbi:NlpC/P60 family peptidoglycan-binding protein RipD [Mycolicibacterium monacense]|uniref:Hydrolase n=2 Tax=Mycobacteriaceae TaxID=1762 RepID=A0AAD1IU65_MYCMB|nr:NlpC/P60 family peptidoglycan-binding protein RipD [Mycolicibacterium monacense]MDA4101031.1 hydrolase [Mycolicibacterium monacense DSM 44395]OBB66048.1 hydrolase [Mycolicibacterium monacense]OBF53908.1 hydrolase [Mycolicibacterium monacense]ORB19784.1 hydrolase [Mycolicibacterium monacense DSM 44395]QHP86414.1 NlpC/P60 family peptidoglycan-binding protein RipD [Mycolicibacterium monacense DSM 44395]
MRRIYAVVICLALSLATAGTASAELFPLPTRNQQAVDLVIARALSQRGVPFAYGGGNTAGPTLGNPGGSSAPAPAAAPPGAIPVDGTNGAIPIAGLPAAAPALVLPEPPRPQVVGFDASGLMVYAFAGAGLKIPRTSGDQYLVGRKVLPSQALPGDLIFYGPNGTQSVAMFIGGGQMVEATDPVVQVSPVRTNNMAPYLVRYID